jgi:cysteine-rich repeat protein
MRSALPCVVALLFGGVLLGGCGLGLDFDPPDPDAGGGFDAQARDAGRDAGLVVDDCTGLDDGTVCGSDAPGVCVTGVCVPSTCGDGFVDLRAGEECEGETASCVACRFVCECPRVPCATPSCEGAECVLTPLSDSTPCTNAAGNTGTCNGGVCRGALCGNGMSDTGEACDDGNSAAGDGCEPDCSLTCDADADCDDNDRCNGVERCAADPESPSGSSLHVCLPGDAPSLESCQRCDPDLGPFFLDADGDGFFDADPAGCGERDCDDGDPTVNPGAHEECDGLDNDCDSIFDEDVTTVVCGPDLDGDGWPTGDMTSTRTCVPCGPGTAPVRTDAGGVAILDCWDDPTNGADVFPGQRTYFDVAYCVSGTPGCALPFDYNCNGAEEELDASAGTRCDLLSLAGCRGGGWDDGAPACGAPGSYAVCAPVLLLGCRATFETRIQACR